MENLQENAVQGISDADAERIAESLAAALENRRQRAERAVINSFARQNNVSADVLLGLLEQRRGRASDTIPPDVQSAIDRRLRAADDRLIQAEIRDVGAQLGLIDAEAAFALMDRSGIQVGADGSVSGVRESLQALLRGKPYLAGGASAPSTGSAGNFPRASADVSDYASRLALARSTGNNTLAAALIAEAAEKGICLR